MQGVVDSWRQWWGAIQDSVGQTESDGFGPQLDGAKHGDILSSRGQIRATGHLT